jgi:hypothetical protein
MCLFRQIGDTALLLACCSVNIGGDSADALKLVQWLVEEAGSDASTERSDVSRQQRDNSGCSCTPVALDCTLPPWCRVQDGDTPLLLAVISGNGPLVEWLVMSAGSNAHVERDNVSVPGRFALRVSRPVRVAASANQQYVLMLQNGNTALLLACSVRNFGIARWLVQVAGSNAKTEKNLVCGLRAPVALPT